MRSSQSVVHENSNLDLVMSKLSTQRIIPGMTVYHEGARHYVVDLVSATRVLIKSENGQSKTVAATDIFPDLAQQQDVRWLLSFARSSWWLSNWAVPVESNFKQREMPCHAWTG